MRLRVVPCLLACLAVVVPAACASAADSGPPVAVDALPQRLVNLGGALEAPADREWGVAITPELLDDVADAGFDGVRLPVRWQAHTDPTAPFTVSPGILARVDRILDHAERRDLAVIVDYADRPANVLFELLNEPTGELTAEVWNDLLNAALAEVRRADDDRLVVVGPVWGNRADRLPTLELPAADFVEGSEAWVGTPFTAADHAEIGRAFAEVARWARVEDRPVLLGEFGAVREMAPGPRARWIAAVRDAAEARGFSWAYWELASGFGLYDAATRTWDEDVRAALLGPDGP